jgi:hypothetical protein
LGHMADRPLLFELFRLNVVDDSAVFPFMGRIISSDEDILGVLENGTDSRFDLLTESPRGTFKWSLRQFTRYETDLERGSIELYGVTLARSLLTQRGQTVTESAIEDALSQLSPPSAATVQLLLYMERHLAIVEYNSDVMSSQLWRSTLHKILDDAASSREFRSSIRLEPIPAEEQVLGAFRSFQVLTRLRVKLRIPNPELDRRTERLRREMMSGQIREYTQDMKNSRGLSQDEHELPFASAVMAQAGYKEGDVIMSGIRDGESKTIRTGSRAVRGRIDGLKDFVRGMATNAKAKETKNVLASIIKEVDRLAEAPVTPDSDLK